MRPGDANVELILPDDTVRTVNLLRMLVQTQNAEFKARHGMFLPTLNKLHPTVKALRDEYGIPARTWNDAAVQMRQLYTEINNAITMARAIDQREEIRP
jgi:ferric iron reductase protein FhuF